MKTAQQLSHTNQQWPFGRNLLRDKNYTASFHRCHVISSLYNFSILPTCKLSLYALHYHWLQNVNQFKGSSHTFRDTAQATTNIIHLYKSINNVWITPRYLFLVVAFNRAKLKNSYAHFPSLQQFKL
jgi:hypothetical protein